MASCKSDHFFSHWPRLVYGTWKNICPVAQLVFPAIQIHVTWPIKEVKASCLLTSSKKMFKFFFVQYHRLCDLKISEVEILLKLKLNRGTLPFVFIFYVGWIVCTVSFLLCPPLPTPTSPTPFSFIFQKDYMYIQYYPSPLKGRILLSVPPPPPMIKKKKSWRTEDAAKKVEGRIEGSQ